MRLVTQRAELEALGCLLHEDIAMLQCDIDQAYYYIRDQSVQ
jgi:hypothetical protein